MKTIIFVSFFILLLSSIKIYAQNKDKIDVGIPDTIYPPPTNPPISPCDPWLRQHNEKLLVILDTLIKQLYNPEQIAALKAKFSQHRANTQQTTEYRTKAIMDFLRAYIYEPKKRIR